MRKFRLARCEYVYGSSADEGFGPGNRVVEDYGVLDEEGLLAWGLRHVGDMGTPGAAFPSVEALWAAVAEAADAGTATWNAGGEFDYEARSV